MVSVLLGVSQQARESVPCAWGRSVEYVEAKELALKPKKPTAGAKTAYYHQCVLIDAFLALHCSWSDSAADGV